MWFRVRQRCVFITSRLMPEMLASVMAVTVYSAAWHISKQAIILLSPQVHMPSMLLLATPAHPYHCPQHSKQIRCKAYSLSVCLMATHSFNLYKHQQMLYRVCQAQEVHPTHYPTIQIVHGR